MILRSWLLLPLQLEALNVGISLSLTGIYRRQVGFIEELPEWARAAYQNNTNEGQLQEWPCFWCTRVVDTLLAWRRQAQDLDLALEIRDDGANFTRAMENYRSMSQTADILFGPSLGIWNPFAANVVTSYGKIIVTWASVYAYYLADYRTEVCPYCREAWFRETDWAYSVPETDSFVYGRVPAAIPTGTRTPPGDLELNWAHRVGSEAVQGSGRAALRALHQLIQAEGQSSSSWLFVHLPVGQYIDCNAFKAEIDGWENTTTSIAKLDISTTLWNPLATTTDVDVLIFCGATSLLGEGLIQVAAASIQTKAIVLELPAGVGKIFGLGAFLVNYLMEPLPIPAVLPNATDAVFLSLENLAEQLGGMPDIASLQVASCASLVTQAIRQEGWSNVSDAAALVNVMKTPIFETLLGRYGQGPVAFRQWLPSNARHLNSFNLELAAGPLNSNALLISAEMADACQGAPNTSLVCQSPVLVSPAYPMPQTQERFQEAYLCPEGSSLQSLSCQPCQPGFFRREGMLHCQACQENYYINVAGAASCLPCPSVSTSCLPDRRPRLLPGYFTFTGDYAFFSNATKYPALSDFVFGFEGYFNNTQPELDWILFRVAAPGVEACADQCFLNPECDGFSYYTETRECWLAAETLASQREGILEQIADSTVWHYWKQSVLEKLNLTELKPYRSGEFPVNTSGLEFDQCFVPMPCAGDTTCTAEGNTGFFCSSCKEGYGFDAFFPAGRMCTLCAGPVVMHLRMWILVLLRIVITLGIFGAAHDVAKGSLSLTIPSLKLLFYYFLILSTVLDMNFFLVGDFIGQLVRYPLEFMLQPWSLMQVGCIMDVLPFLPTNGKTGSALLLHLQQSFGLYSVIGVFALVVAQSLLLTLQRLSSFLNMKLPDFTKENLHMLSHNSPARSQRSRKEKEAESPMESPKEPAGFTSEATQLRADRSVRTTLSHSFDLKGYKRMVWRYYWMHFQFKLVEEVRSCFRRLTVIAFFLLPIYLRALVIPWRCMNMGSSEININVEFPDLLCSSSDIVDLRYNNRFLTMLIAVPSLYLVVMLLTERWKNHVTTQEALCFLTAGLKDRARWWFVVLELRISIFFFLMSILEGSRLRNLLVLFMCVLYALLEIQVNPWSSTHNMVLTKSSRMLNVSLVLISTVGAWLRGTSPTIGPGIRMLDVVVIMLSIPGAACGAYGIIMLVLSLFSEVFFSKMHVLLIAGGSTGPWTKAIFYATNWFVGILFEMHFTRKGDSNYVLEHSQLNSFNRRQLLKMLVELIHQCLARHGRFRLRMVEVMLIIAFERAMQVRRGLINDNFHQHGHSLHSLTYLGFPKVLSPDPDLAPLMDLKVTLAELQDALETLTKDINEGDPELIYRSHVGDDATVTPRHQLRRQKQFFVWDGDFQEMEGKVLSVTGYSTEEEVASGPASQVEGIAGLLRRLTGLMELLLQQYQGKVEDLAKAFQEEMFQALGEMRLADAEDRTSRLGLAEEAMNRYGAGAAEADGEEGQSRVVLRAVSMAQEFMTKVKAWEEASEVYFTKALERLPKVCAGEKHLEDMKSYERKLRDAKSACYTAHERLEHALQACKAYKPQPMPRLVSPESDAATDV